MGFERTIKKNSNEIIKVYVDKYKDQKLLHIRVFVPDKTNNQEYIPTKKGVALRLELFPEFKKILDELEEELKKNQ